MEQVDKLNQEKSEIIMKVVIKYLSSGQYYLNPVLYKFQYLKQNPIRSFSNLINGLQGKEQVDILIKKKGNIILMVVKIIPTS